MKNLILIFAVATIFSSCSKSGVEPDDNSSSNGNSKVTGSMKGVLSGKDWIAKTLKFDGLTALIDATGFENENNKISLQFVDTILKIDTVYQFTNPAKKENLNSNLLITYNNSPLFAKSGNFKITKSIRDKEIEGTINAQLTNYVDLDMSLTNLKFSLKK